MPVLLAFLSFVLLRPQSADLTGTWAVQVEAAQQATADGGSRSRSALAIELVLEVRGADATARFQSKVGGLVTLKGTWRDGKLDLASDWQEVDATRNGQSSKGKVRWVIKGGLRDGVLGGTWDLQFGDSSLPQRWTGRRK